MGARSKRSQPPSKSASGTTPVMGVRRDEEGGLQHEGLSIARR